VEDEMEQVEHHLANIIDFTIDFPEVKREIQ
jgi:hypothetical protein